MCVFSTRDVMVSMYSNGITNYKTKVVFHSESTEKTQFNLIIKVNLCNQIVVILNISSRIETMTSVLTDCGAGAIVMVKQDGKFIWRSNGYQEQTIKPYVITTDIQSGILTADRDKHCIHILDQNGQFFRYIYYCNLKGHFGLCVDNNDSLFVDESRNGNVKKTKYLK